MARSYVRCDGRQGDGKREKGVQEKRQRERASLPSWVIRASGSHRPTGKAATGGIGGEKGSADPSSRQEWTQTALGDARDSKAHTTKVSYAAWSGQWCETPEGAFRGVLAARWAAQRPDRPPRRGGPVALPRAEHNTHQGTGVGGTGLRRGAPASALRVCVCVCVYGMDRDVTWMCASIAVRHGWGRGGRRPRRPYQRVVLHGGVAGGALTAVGGGGRHGHDAQRAAGRGAGREQARCPPQHQSETQPERHRWYDRVTKVVRTSKAHASQQRAARMPSVIGVQWRVMWMEGDEARHAAAAAGPPGGPDADRFPRSFL